MSYREGAIIPRPCPRCSEGLFTGKVGHLDAQACGACGGLWLDNAGTTEVVQRYDLDAARLAAMIDGNAAQKGEVSPFAATAGLCPICNKPLQPTDHQGIRLDFCAAHGTFFDRGELARVLDRVKPPPAPPAAPNLAALKTDILRTHAERTDPLGTALNDFLWGTDWVNKRGWFR